MPGWRMMAGFWQLGSSMYWNAFGKYNVDRKRGRDGALFKLGLNNLDNRCLLRAVDANGNLSTLYASMLRDRYVHLTKGF